MGYCAKTGAIDAVPQRCNLLASIPHCALRRRDESILNSGCPVRCGYHFFAHAGAIPPQLGQLSALEKLDLPDNDLTGKSDHGFGSTSPGWIGGRCWLDNRPATLFFCGLVDVCPSRMRLVRRCHDGSCPRANTGVLCS